MIDRNYDEEFYTTNEVLDKFKKLSSEEKLEIINIADVLLTSQTNSKETELSK